MKKVIKTILVIWVINTYGLQSANSLCIESFYYQTDKLQERINKMDQVVGLSADQKIKYKTLLEKNDKEKIEFQAKAKDKPLEERKKMQSEFKNAFEKELKSILTAEQWKKIETERTKNQKQ